MPQPPAAPPRQHGAPPVHPASPPAQHPAPQQHPAAPPARHPAAPQHPAAPSAQRPAAPQHPAAPPAQQPAPQHPAAPPAQQQAPHPAAPPARHQHPQAPHPHTAAAGQTAQDVTGHVPLPPGGPVGMPAVHPAASSAPDPAATTLAVLLIGPAGAGKTSVAKYWADHRRVPTAHISLDDVREWVRAGFADPQSGWNDHSEAQYRLARRTCGFAARNFLANGISCILDDAVFPDRPVVGLGGWKRHVGPGLLPVVLLPGLDVVLERNAERSGNRRLTDEEVARIHGRMAGWYGSGLPIIDNSQLDVPGTARVLDEVLARAIASPPSW
ncbi:AAA family ATPase [Streptomyces sp. NPDC090108]|uniref:AAA family ATPase n=1 Tax=Streptomyces sp. NPDC090108 TaxID=3365947 RepID=UPI00382B2706